LLDFVVECVVSLESCFVLGPAPKVYVARAMTQEKIELQKATIPLAESRWWQTLELEIYELVVAPWAVMKNGRTPGVEDGHKHKGGQHAIDSKLPSSTDTTTALLNSMSKTRIQNY